MAPQALSSATGASLVVCPPPWKPRVEGRTWRLSSWPASSSACNRSRCFRLSFRIGSVRCKAVGQNNRGSFDDSIVYQGVYGPWTLDSSDVREVFCVTFSLLSFDHITPLSPFRSLFSLLSP